MRRTRLPLVSLNSKVRSDSTANICKSNVKQSVNSAVMYHVGKNASYALNKTSVTLTLIEGVLY